MPLSLKHKRNPFNIARLWHWQTSNSSSSDMQAILEEMDKDTSSATAQIQPTDSKKSPASERDGLGATQSIAQCRPIYGKQEMTPEGTTLTTISTPYAQLNHDKKSPTRQPSLASGGPKCSLLLPFVQPACSTQGPSPFNGRTADESPIRSADSQGPRGELGDWPSTSTQVKTWNIILKTNKATFGRLLAKRLPGLNLRTKASSHPSGYSPPTPTSPSPTAKDLFSLQHNTQTFLCHLAAFDFDKSAANHARDLAIIWNTLLSRNLTRRELKDLCILSQNSADNKCLKFQPDSIHFSAVFGRLPPALGTLIRSCYVTDEPDEFEQTRHLPVWHGDGERDKMENRKLLFSFLPIGHLLLGASYTDWIVVLDESKDIWFLRHDSFGKNFTPTDEDMNEALETLFECTEGIEKSGICVFNRATDSWTKNVAQWVEMFPGSTAGVDVVKAGPLSKLIDRESIVSGWKKIEKHYGRWESVPYCTQREVLVTDVGSDIYRFYSTLAN
ncbi:hypothetical protein BKA65DRAFT_477558 [Rhexocercosporidium sp. MPI-PUGE-AT-0058]|nr:hypothetical protein BKA65DRAFT_477558 [Rhexocercosporidium sp. MPI-PUGE-AT-0058]